MKKTIKLFILLIPLYMAINAFVVPTLVEYDYLPIVHFDKQPIIEAKLNGKKAYFMLDSGSSLSLLNSGESSNFEFSVSKKGPQETTLSGIGGQGKKLKYAYDYQLGLGLQAEMKADFYAYELNLIFDQMKEFKPIGIIGGDFMRRYSFQIDFKQKQVRFRTHKK